MALLMARISSAPVSPAARADSNNSFAPCAPSALRLAMLAISSSEALVSSSEAAWALVPSAKDWLELETWWAASVVCSAPKERMPMALLMGRLTERAVKSMITIPMTSTTIPEIKRMNVMRRMGASSSAIGAVTATPQCNFSLVRNNARFCVPSKL